ncbi:hypothetical protein Tco_1092287, partial [Tanacetum coccineum]
MINRDSRGHSYFIVRGEILGFMKDEQLRKHLPRDVYHNQERKVGGSRRHQNTVLVSTINDVRPKGSAVVAYRTPAGTYGNQSFLGSGGIRSQGLKLKELTEGHHQEWSLRLNLTQHGETYQDNDISASRIDEERSKMRYLVVELQNPVNQRVFERKLRALKLLAEGNIAGSPGASSIGRGNETALPLCLSSCHGIESSKVGHFIVSRTGDADETGKPGLRLPTLEMTQSEVGSNGWKSTARRAVSASGRWNNVGKESQQNGSVTLGKGLALRAGHGGLSFKPADCRRTARAAYAARACRRVPAVGRNGNGSFG